MATRQSAPYSSAYEVAASPPSNPWRWIYAVIFILLLVWIRSVEPRAGVTPSCPTLSLFGVPCPGCGSLRAFHALLHGHVDRAWALNPSATLLLPVIGLLTIPKVRDIVGDINDKHPYLLGTIGFLFVAGTVAFWATRAPL